MLGKVSIAVKTFGVCDFSRLVVTDWRLCGVGACGFGAYDSYPILIYSLDTTILTKYYNIRTKHNNFEANSRS